MNRQPLRRTMRALTLGVALAALAVLLPGAALAGERAGVRMPDTFEAAKTRLVLNGMGVREATAFKVDVYVAGLYLPRRSRDPGEILAMDGPKVLHLMFVRDVDRSDVVEAFSDGFDKNAEHAAALRPRIKQLLAWIPAFDDGDTMTLTYIPGVGTHVAIDGKHRGTIEGADFARGLFAIWLGPKPPNSGLKKGLLGR